jgi:1-acyl-sn-glycerol-3-phosphate acyltransferase
MVLIFPEGQINQSQNSFLDFKTGVVLMAIKTGKPIIPTCIIKREKWWKRTVVIVGEPLFANEFVKNENGLPSMKEIDEIGVELKKRENELRAFYETECNK